MIPDDLEDLKDKIDFLEVKIMRVVETHSVQEIFQALIRIISTLLVCQEDNPVIRNERFQKCYKDLCNLCSSLEEDN